MMRVILRCVYRYGILLGKNDFGMFLSIIRYMTFVRSDGTNINRSISRLYYRGANACILCYDITSVSSFTAMSHWLTELRTHLPPDIILHVVGTKADVVSRDPSARQVPFERCIAYIAENLNPGQTSTPPATATPGGVVNDSQHRKYLPTELGGDGAPKSPGATSNSKRSSGFWGMDIAWDCCHEVSAESGEGVDEVFRVVTRKLVEQNRKIREQLLSATNGALTPGPGMVQAKTPAGFPGTPWAMGRVKEEGEGYLDRLGGERPKVRPGGSFRVGRDRRSWLGFPTPGFDRERSMQGFPWGAGIDNGAIEEGLEGSQAGSQEGKGSREGGRCC